MPTSTFRAGDARVSPLVFIHSISGRTDDYRQLAAAIEWIGPLIGVSAPPVPDHGAYRLADLAARYCAEIDVSMPAMLIGWSIGGVIAAEMTRVLAEQGRPVAFLGVIDSRASQPEMRKRPTDRDALARFFLHQRALTREAESIPPAAANSEALLAGLRTMGIADDIGDTAELERRLAVFMALVRGFFVHDERTLPTKLHLFEAEDAHPSHPKPATLGWDDLAPSIERHFVPGTHFTVLAPRHIETLARTISGCLPR